MIGGNLGDDPCLRRLLQDLAAAPVQAGVAAGMWRVVEVDFPTLTVTVSLGSGQEMGLRLAVDSYPLAAPAGQPWDLAGDCPLPQDRWPVSGRAPEVFRTDWSPDNGNSPYLACDRNALASHNTWPAQSPDRCWDGSRTIGFYLAELHRELGDAWMPTPGGSA